MRSRNKSFSRSFIAFSRASPLTPRAVSSARICLRVRSISLRVMMSPLILATISSTRWTSAASSTPLASPVNSRDDKHLMLVLSYTDPELVLP
jgi:hypothetical protein